MKQIFSVFEQYMAQDCDHWQKDAHVASFTFTQAFPLGTLSKLQSHIVEAKDGLVVLWNVGNKDHSLGLLRQLEFVEEGSKEREHSRERAPEICTGVLLSFWMNTKTYVYI